MKTFLIALLGATASASELTVEREAVAIRRVADEDVKPIPIPPHDDDDYHPCCGCGCHHHCDHDHPVDLCDYDTTECKTP